jgi:hypothetical protein
MTEPEYRGCGAHPEFVKATSQLMESVTVLSSNVHWIVNIGKGVFATGLALIVMIIFAIYNAGSLSDRVLGLRERVDILEQQVHQHVINRNGHHDEIYKKETRL